MVTIDKLHSTPTVYATKLECDKVVDRLCIDEADEFGDRDFHYYAWPIRDGWAVRVQCVATGDWIGCL